MSAISRVRGVLCADGEPAAEVQQLPGRAVHAADQRRRLPGLAGRVVPDTGTVPDLMQLFLFLFRLNLGPFGPFGPLQDREG